MNQPLPTGGLEWIDPSLIMSDKIDGYANEGYLLEVDIRYPKE